MQILNLKKLLMLRNLLVIITSLVGALFSGLTLFSGVEHNNQLILSLYFFNIAPVLLLFEVILGEHGWSDKLSHRWFSAGMIFSLLSLAVAVNVLLFPDLFRYSHIDNALLGTSYISTIVLAIHITALVYGLYLLENIYRFALLYQRRIGWVSFFGFLVFVCHQLFFTTKWLLYGWIADSWFRFAAILYLYVTCAIPWSFVRYRMDRERIKVTRDAVYSSFSLLIIGALFTAVGVTISALRIFKVSFTPFDFRVLGMSILFAGTILAGSARMRRRIAKLVNRRIYSNRYDYRFQFFSLHRILGRVEGYKETIEEILEHLRKTLNAEHAYLFLANEQNGNFELFSPKERDLPDAAVIISSSQFINTLKGKGDYFGLLQLKNELYQQIVTDTSENLKRLRITHVAPVFNSDSLLAILALRCDRVSGFDTEDTALVEAYASVIADFLFKHRILRERLEQKQFESFSHMASFIVHDVKNQVATLKLLLRNAKQNISNPKFQESLLLSLDNCTVNLDNLVSKLSMPPQRDRLKVSKSEVSPVLKKLVEETGLESLPQIKFDFKTEDNLYAQIDENALYYTVKNLVVNSLEAMEGRDGKLSITASSLQNALGFLTDRFSGNQHYFSTYSAVIIIEDTGCGMSDEFLKNRLFRPFSTTKDKGIGIGLYQCKTLVEQMGGKLLCDSHLGSGTVFCVILH
jgi:putative PEP-CTERM system histidine kinase